MTHTIKWVTTFATAITLAVLVSSIGAYYYIKHYSPQTTYTFTMTETYISTIPSSVETVTITTTTLKTIATPIPQHNVNYPLEIIDSAGRRVIISKEPQKVVVIASTHAYALAALGVADKIVGGSDTVVNDPILMSVIGHNITVIGSFSKPNIEAIIACEPDLVITYASFYRDVYMDIANRLPNTPVVMFDLYIPNTMFDEMYKLGLIFNRVDKALELIGKWSSRFAYIVGKVAEIRPSDRVKVFLETYTELGTAGPGSGWHQNLVLAGGINIFADATAPYPKVSPEEVIARDPDVIIKLVSSTTFNPCKSNTTKPIEAVYSSILARPGWRDLNAVKNGRFYVVTTAYQEVFGRVVQLAMLAKILYPNVFIDVDPMQWQMDWLKDIGIGNPETVCKPWWVYPEVPKA